MTDEKWPWREFLRGDEIERVRELDAEIARLDAEIADCQAAANPHRVALQLIRSRATQRAIRQRAQ